MTGVAASNESDTVCISGRGISVAVDFPLTPGITIRPNPPKHELQAVADGCGTFADYAAILAMMPYASFYLEIRHVGDPKELAIKAWNSLWMFHLLGLATQSPCNSLYSWSGRNRLQFSVATPHPIHQSESPVAAASIYQLEWARSYLNNFDELQKDRSFSRALISYGNSHFLFGYDSRIMLLWSAIECLFKVSTELSRTLAPYSALMLEPASPNARYDLYKKIRKEYDRRSKVVHGAQDKDLPLEEIYKSASDLLVKLLAKCVELSRVPSSEELDRAALIGFIEK
jgi:hypothetical protein